MKLKCIENLIMTLNEEVAFCKGKTYSFEQCCEWVRSVNEQGNNHYFSNGYPLAEDHWNNWFEQVEEK